MGSKKRFTLLLNVTIPIWVRLVNPLNLTGNFLIDGSDVLP